MEYSDQFMEHIEYCFDKFCKVVLRYALMNAWRDMKRKQQRETSLDYLLSETLYEPYTMDSYFETQTAFCVRGETVIIENEQLATALSRLTAARQEVLLLYFFLGYRDIKIGKLYGICRSSANSRRRIAMKHLKKELERLGHEKQKNDTV